METLEKIKALENEVKSASACTTTGRQIVAKACKELYLLIEDDVYNAGLEWMLEGIYLDTCTGSFAEPFMCELKKTTFSTINTIYHNTILPRLKIEESN